MGNAPGLLNPVDEKALISPGQLCGGDTTLLYAGPPLKEDFIESTDVLIGLIQGLSIQSQRNIRSVYEIGTVSPMLATSKGGKTLSMNSIITEDSSLLSAIYKYLIKNRATLEGKKSITPTQSGILSAYADKPYIEGLARDLFRIPFGLSLTIMSGDMEPIQKIYLENCMISTSNSSIDAGGRGIPEGSSISWQKTIYTQP